MLFNKKPCCGMMGQEPMMMHGGAMMGQNPMQMHGGAMMGQNPMLMQEEMMEHGGYAGRDGGCGCGCGMDPIIEAPIEKCIQREFCHEVKHVCPIHTKVINNHIYRHVYDPCYTCSEENVVCNIDQGSCCNFQ